MNTERSSLSHGVLAGALALLVFAVSVAHAPVGTDATPSEAGLGVSASSVLYSPVSPSARAVLPASAALPAPGLERSLPEGPPGAFSPGTSALFVGGSPQVSAAERPVLAFGGAPFPRHVFLQVYRC